MTILFAAPPIVQTRETRCNAVLRRNFVAEQPQARLQFDVFDALFVAEFVDDKSVAYA